MDPMGADLFAYNYFAIHRDEIGKDILGVDFFGADRLSITVTAGTSIAMQRISCLTVV